MPDFSRWDLTVRWIEVRSQPRLDRAGHVGGYLGIVADITERKKHEEHVAFVSREIATQTVGRHIARTASSVQLHANMSCAPPRQFVSLSLR